MCWGKVCNGNHSTELQSNPTVLFNLFIAVDQKLAVSTITSSSGCVFLQGYIYIYIYIYTGCPRRNVPDFGRVFLMLKYTDITQNTYVQSWTVTELMAREKWGLLAVPNTATCTADTSRDNASGLEWGMQCSLCLRDALRSQSCYVTAGLSHV